MNYKLKLSYADMVECPNCGSAMEVLEKKEYSEYKCPKCGYKILDLEMAYD